MQVALPGELRDSVGRDRVELVIFGCRKLTLLPIDRATRRSEDDLFGAVANTVLKEPERAQHVDLRVEVRLAYRAADVHLGGLMAERLRPELREDFGASVPDVPLVENGPLRDVFLLPA